MPEDTARRELADFLLASALHGGSHPVNRQLFNGAPSLAAFQWTVGRAT